MMGESHLKFSSVTWKWVLAFFSFSLEPACTAGQVLLEYDSGDKNIKAHPHIPEPGSAIFDGHVSGESFHTTTESIPYITSYLYPYYSEETAAGYYESTYSAYYPDKEEPTNPTPMVVTDATALRENKVLFQVPESPKKAEVVDLLKELRLSTATGFKIVPGSQSGLKAYQLESSITRKTRFVLTYGLPREFAIVCTFRIRHPSLAWDLWVITGIDGADQFRLRLFGESCAVEVYHAGAATSDTVAVFEDVRTLFDGAWHKLALSAQRNQIVLYVDCQQISTAPVNYYGRIRADGEMVLSRRIKNYNTLVVEMQKLQLYKNYNLVLNETCCEIPGGEDESSEDPGASGEEGPSGNSGAMSEPCLPGPPGEPGIKGEIGDNDEASTDGGSGAPGEKGSERRSEEQELLWPKGPKGFSGDDGPKGMTGVQGLMGYPGIMGKTGEEGPKGDEGYPGIPGNSGTPGNNGPLGIPGLEGKMGLKGQKGDKGDPGLRGPLGRLGNTGHQDVMGELGVPGKQGPKGRKGQRGPQGEPGEDGPKGEMGRKGEKGNAGPKGDVGEQGDKGQEGKHGFSGISGPKGQRVVYGWPGPRGLPGPTGEIGATGSPGSQGPPGPKDFLQFPEMANQEYPDPLDTEDHQDILDLLVHQVSLAYVKQDYDAYIPDPLVQQGLTKGPAV